MFSLSQPCHASLAGRDRGLPPTGREMAGVGGPRPVGLPAGPGRLAQERRAAPAILAPRTAWAVFLAGPLPAMLAAVLLALALCAGQALALDVPRLTGRVNDNAGMLSKEAISRLDAALADFQRTDSTQLVVLTIPSLQGEPLEDYAIKVAQAWGIGQKGKDNGVLLLVSKGDRKVRIEVGYGLEGRLTDALTGRIIDHAIVPAFKAGRFDAGIEAGVAAIIEGARGEYQAAPGGGNASGHDDNAFFGLFILAIILSALLSGLPALARASLLGVALPLGGALFGQTLAMLGLLCLGGAVLGLVGPFLFSGGSGRRGGGGFYIGGGGGSSGGGGGFSGGGGSFGGGGSSGSW